MNAWRDNARSIIASVIEQTRGQDAKDVQKALRDAYPFGPMRYHPYKIWRDEVRLQLGLKKVETKEAPPPDPRQGSLL